MTDASWYPDPTGQAELRYYDGSQWTQHVSTQGVQSTAPLTPPAEPAAEHTARTSDQPPQSHGGDPFAGVSGDLLDGRYSEVDSAGASLQNKKMLRVRLGEPFQARQGAMVAYQGNVSFKHQGAGGIGKFLKRAVTGEGLALMAVEGQGDVFLADKASDVHVLNLNNSGISINGDRVLAFSAGLDWNIERVQGAGMLTGGLFNTTLRGTGWVAVTTDGEPVVLNAAEAPTFTDTNAVVGWSLGLQTSLQKSFTAGALIGRGSGEAFQVAFHGNGFVIVQPSEGAVVPPHSHGSGGGISFG